MKDATQFLSHNPTLLASYGLGQDCQYRLFEHPTRGDEAPVYMVTPTGYLINTGFYDLGDFEEDGFSLCLELEADAYEQPRIVLSGKMCGQL